MRKQNQKEISRQDSKLKPYCFPKMSVDVSSVGAGEGKESVFRKLIDEGSRYQGDIKPFSNRESTERLRADANHIQDEAYAEGFRKGERKGLESFREKLEPVLDGFKNAVFRVEDANKRVLVSAEKEAVQLALAIAKVIIQREVEMNPEVVLEVVRKALEKVVDHKRVKIRLSPTDLRFIQEVKPEMLDSQSRFETVTLEEDASMTSGGCIIETELGDVDARIEKQIQVITEAFNNEIRKK